MGRGAAGSRGHPALVSEATRSPGETDIPGPWKQGIELSLRRMRGHLRMKAFLLEPPQTCLWWSLKPLTFPFYLKLSFLVFPASSCFHHGLTHLSLSLTFSSRGAPRFIFVSIGSEHHIICTLILMTPFLIFHLYFNSFILPCPALGGSVSHVTSLLWTEWPPTAYWT